MTRLHLALLGPLHVSLDRQSVTSFGYAKVRALLVYLVVEAHRPHNRSALAALLWPGELDSIARKNLRTALATLRQAIDDTIVRPPFLRITRDSIQFNRASDYEMDVDVFDELLSQVKHHAHPDNSLCAECASLLARAAELYRSEFAQGIEVANSPAWEEWVLVMRERLRGQMLDTLDQLMAYHEASDGDSQARHYAWRALSLEAWDEAAHRCLMRVYMRSGQRNAALAQYERCRNVLIEELGIELAAETMALGERIRSGPLERAGETTRPAQIPGDGRIFKVFTTNLPVPPTPLIGRTSDVATLAAQLQQSNLRLLTLTGPPGIGKTRLSLAVAAATEHLFNDGVWFIPLAALRDTTLVLPAIAKALEVREDGEQSLIEALKTHVRSKQMLLVLDNFEQVLDAALQIAELLAAAFELKMLVTSRVALRLSSEHVFVVPPLELPELIQLPDSDQLAEYAAVQLFLERARAADGSFTLTSENARAVAETCIQLDGLPLAIELAASRTTVVSIEELLARLRRRLAVLTKAPRDFPERHLSLRAAITWSYDLLTSDEQTLFRRCAIFASGCTLEALEQVGIVAAEQGQGRGILDWLVTLLDHHLIQRIDSSTRMTRFAMLETIREYAIEQLSAHGEEVFMRQQHADFFLRWVEQAALALNGTDQTRWLDHMEEEHDNLRAALGWFEKQGNAQTGLRLISALFEFWLLRGYFNEGRAWIEQFLAQGLEPTLVHAKALYSAGMLAYRQGNHQIAQGRYEQSLQLYRDLNNISGMAMTLNSLGELARNHGDYNLATIYFEESLLHYRALGDSKGTAAVLNSLGATQRDTGDFDAANTLLQESVALYRTVGDRSGVAASLFRLGTVAYYRKDYAAERGYLEESLAIRQSLGDTWGIAYTLNNLGILAASLHHFEQAANRYEKALTLFEGLNDKDGIAMIHTNQGELARAMGEYNQAADHYQESLRIHRELGYKMGIARGLLNLGHIALHEGDSAWAATQFRQGLELYREITTDDGMLACIAGLAGVANAQGQVKWAAHLLGAVNAFEKTTGISLGSSDQLEYDRVLVTVRMQLDEVTWTTAWEIGRATSLEQVVNAILDQEAQSTLEAITLSAG